MNEGIDRRWIFVAFALVACGIVAAVLIGRSGGGSSKSASSATSCREVEAPAPKHIGYRAPKPTLKKGEKATAVVKTNCGTFEIALATAEAPKTANSFAFLADQGFYDDLTFQRVIPESLIQGGDPLGNGAGGPGYHVDEKPPANLSYTKWVVAMAKTSADPPGRSGSQFFVVLAPDLGLQPEYALLGKVSGGFGVLNRIGSLGAAEEKPKQTVLIEKLTIEKG